MKGCLKLTHPSPGLDSQAQHLDSLDKHGGGIRCCYTPTIALSSSTAASASSCTVTTTNTTSTTQTQTHHKCVAFCAEGSETVYTADEWDRTPTEPARKLSYQDLLELKEIQRSLPHANQPPDVVTGRPGKQFLSGVPIVLLPLLGSDESPSGGDGARAPPFPFPPRPVPFSTPASTPTFTSARAPALPSPIIQPWRMNSQSQNKSGSSPTSPPFPFSPTSSYPASYAKGPSSTSTSTTYVPQRAQPRTAWAPPPSLSHLMPARPIKPREKPKFEFITLLDNGAGSGGNSTSFATVTPGGTNGVGNVETTTAKVGPEVLHPISKLPSGSVGIEGKLESDRHDHGMKKKPEPEKEKKKKKRFILVNDIEMELDDSEIESDSEKEDFAALSGRITSTSTSTTRETITTTTKTTTTEKTTTTTTTTTTSSGSPQTTVAPVPGKSALWGSHPPPSSSASAPLITPPTTPPPEQIARYGSHTAMHSPTSSPSAASRGRIKAIQKKGRLVGNSTSRERSGSMDSDTSGCGSPSPTSPNRSCTVMKMGSPVKSKSKTWVS